MDGNEDLGGVANYVENNPYFRERANAVGAVFVEAAGAPNDTQDEADYDERLKESGMIGTER